MSDLMHLMTNLCLFSFCCRLNLYMNNFVCAEGHGRLSHLNTPPITYTRKIRVHANTVFQQWHSFSLEFTVTSVNFLGTNNLKSELSHCLQWIWLLYHYATDPLSRS